MPTEHVKSISTLLGIDNDLDTYLNYQLSLANCDAEKVIRLFSTLELMIAAVARELLINQLYTSFDSGVLWNLKTKILTRYFDRKPLVFLDLLHEAAKKIEVPLFEGLSVSDISLAENSTLGKSNSVRNQIVHRAAQCFEQSFADLAELSEVDLTFDQFYNGIRKAINVLHQIYNYAPIAEQSAMSEPEPEFPD